MYPPLQKNIIYHTNARLCAGRFAFCYLPGEMQPGLTKVNKLGISNSKSDACMCMIFPLVKLYNTICDQNLTKPRMYHLTFYHINPLTCYPITLLTY